MHADRLSEFYVSVDQRVYRAIPDDRPGGPANDP
jgi:hypothetical protein